MYMYIFSVELHTRWLTCYYNTQLSIVYLIFLNLLL